MSDHDKSKTYAIGMRPQGCVPAGLSQKGAVPVSDFGKEPVRYRFVWAIYKWEDGWSDPSPRAGDEKKC